jgi:hypothetical protein
MASGAAELVIDYEDLSSSILREGFDYWSDRKRGRSFPARGDFDPIMEVPKLARHMILLDVQHEPLDFRYRLYGTRLREHVGRDWTGIWWSEIEFQRAPNPIWLQHQWVVQNREPRFIRPNYIGPHKTFMFIESAVLPLGDDPGQVDMLMLFVDFLSKLKR